MEVEFTKEFFQRSWGEDGYYENFSYGVGIDKVCAVSLFPFIDNTKDVLEIGPGGGVFTEKIIDRSKSLTVIDVIKMPKRFRSFKNFRYIELPDNTYACNGVEPESIDFCFCYNVFCHLSNKAISSYLKSINKSLKPGASIVFMLSNYENIKEYIPDQKASYVLGDMLPTGHFYQNDKTIDCVIDGSEWKIGSRSMIPEHRDIIVHLIKNKHV